MNQIDRGDKLAKFARLFSPLKVGKIELPNRLVMLAIGTGYAGEAGRWDGKLEAFLEERAQGGVGLVISPFSPCYIDTWLVPGLYDDSFILPLRRLANNIHAHGSKFIVQLLMDREWSPENTCKTVMVSPSGIIKRRGLFATRPLEIEEIHQIAGQFGEAARRVREAGCDGVELHAGMGYLINQFLSPLTNKRTDEYGGSSENRLRFLLEIISEMKAKAGDDFTYLCRISAHEFIDGGLTLNETTKIAKRLETAGIHCLNVQAGWHESAVPLVQSCVSPGAYVYLSEGIKKAVDVPVIAAYRINHPVLAEEIILQGKADLVGMARALIADPELPKKAKEGREDEIRPCIACCHCLDRVMNLESLCCSVNPRVGREAEWVLKPASRVKRVIVVGGGPSGMVAAATAALRGHQVTLYEKGDRLGGQLNYASLSPYKQEIEAFRKYLLGELARCQVNLRLKTVPELDNEKADAVVIAVGAQPLIPSIPGIGRCLTALEVLAGSETGDQVLVVGGGMIGCEVAEHLAAQNKKVIVLEMRGKVGADIGPATRWAILGRLKMAGVRMETKTQVVAITERGVRVKRDCKEEEFAADTVVLAAGMISANWISKKVGQIEVYRVGDCVFPRRIREATEEGMKAGLQI